MGVGWEGLGSDLVGQASKARRFEISQDFSRIKIGPREHSKNMLWSFGVLIWGGVGWEGLGSDLVGQA